MKIDWSVDIYRLEHKNKSCFDRGLGPICIEYLCWSFKQDKP